MHKHVRTAALALALILASSTALSAPLHIVIDPGHGGHDDGAVRGKIREATIALNVSKKLAVHLNSDSRFKVTLTRDNDHALTLPERKKVGKALKADLFLSIHVNSSSDPRAQGVEFYFQNQMPADEEAMFLASRENESISDAEGELRAERVTQKGDVAHIIEDLKRNYRASASNELSKLLLENWENGKNRHNRRPIRQAPFFVVSETSMPAVLVELGFVTNSHDVKKLTSEEHQDGMARNLYEGLVQFKTSFDKDRNLSTDKNEAIASR